MYLSDPERGLSQEEWVVSVAAAAAATEGAGAVLPRVPSHSAAAADARGLARPVARRRETLRVRCRRGSLHACYMLDPVGINQQEI